MSSETLKKIRVRLADQQHPTGKRRRAGFIFEAQPIVVEVTDEQLKAIKEDDYLQILPGKATGKVTAQTPTGDEPPGPTVTTLSERSTKAALIKELTEVLHLTPETDFNPEATNKVLFQLIESTREKLNAEGNKGSEEDNDDDDDNDL